MSLNKSGIRISGLSHRYGNKVALDNVDLELEQGAFCALLGPNGAGKSTLFSLLCRLYVPQTGKIFIAGKELSAKHHEALSQLGIVFQQPTLDLDLTVKQNLSYFAGLQGLSRKEGKQAAELALERLQMSERINEKVRELNGGHRRRMEIARALIHQPKILLLDEPTVGLDAQSRQQITEHVHALAKDDGITVLWATHLVDEVWPDDRLIIIHRGRVIKDGICREITGRRNLKNTFAQLTEGGTE